LQNSQCSVNIGTSSASVSGNTMTLNLAMSFPPGYAGAKKVYMEAFNGTADSGWAQYGTWTVGSGGPVAGPPMPVSVAPSAGSGASQLFTFTFTDAGGATSIVSTALDISTTLAAAGSCYLYFARGSNLLYLAQDNGLFSNKAVVGSTGTLQNSQCTVNTGTSSVSVSGNTLTLNLAISFQAGYAGAKNVYMEAFDGADSGWMRRGTWTVP
jgi:hypothetical protein